MGLMVASLLFLSLSVYAGYRGTFNPCQFDLHSIGNPFMTGNFFSLKSLGNKPDHHGSLACVQSCTMTLYTDDPVCCARQGRSRITTGIHQRDPKLVDNPKGGMPLNKEGILCLEDMSYIAHSPA
ncbi:MAG: hypothetical protein CV089_01450 [Nitrospira sp. WS110]|nr:hypothetical protein [Nitrospira sp. WS110]